MAILTTFARPYARAAFQHALAAGDLESWEKQLALLAYVSQQDKVRRAASSPALSVSQQTQVLANVCGDALSGDARRFLSLLAKNKRLALLPEISRLFAEFKSAHQQQVEVELTTALPLDSDSEQKLIQALTTKLSRKVNIQTNVDPRLLAGVVVKAGDLVIDASVRGRLDKLAKAINS